MSYLEREIALGHLCNCGHAGEEHAANEPRVCKKIDCPCYKFQVSNEYADMLSKIDIFVAEFKKWDQRVAWLCKNMPFLLGFNNTQIIFWYWKYVYPKWDPETEFMSLEIKKAIEGGAKPEAISRAFRLYKEHNPDEVEKFKNLREWQRYNEEGYREGAIEKKRG